MIRRILLIPCLAFVGMVLIGCSENHNEPFIGYWLQDTDKRPVSLHIKEDGSDVIVDIGQLTFGKYEILNEPGHAKQEHLLTVGEGKKQLRYENNALVDLDDDSVRFSRIDETRYREVITIK